MTLASPGTEADQIFKKALVSFFEGTDWWADRQMILVIALAFGHIWTDGKPTSVHSKYFKMLARSLMMYQRDQLSKSKRSKC